MATDTWNPAQYERFRAERSRPFFDLLALVRPRPGMRVVDLGCGTGEFTRVVHERLEARETAGIDSSDAMLAQTGSLAGNGLRFVRGDIRDFASATTPSTASTASTPSAAADQAVLLSGAFDLVLSNAALQWVPGHESLLTALTARLAPGGQLAVQVPANEDHPSHTVAARLAAEPPFREALGGHVRRFDLLPPEGYATLLDRLGCGEQHVRLQVYGHRLASREDVVEWVKGTLLTDYQKRLAPALFQQFVERYRERLLPLLPDTRPFFYPFKRILFWAQR